MLNSSQGEHVLEYGGVARCRTWEFPSPKIGNNVQVFTLLRKTKQYKIQENSAVLQKNCSSFEGGVSPPESHYSLLNPVTIYDCTLIQGIISDLYILHKIVRNSHF